MHIPPANADANTELKSSATLMLCPSSIYTSEADILTTLKSNAEKFEKNHPTMQMDVAVLHYDNEPSDIAYLGKDGQEKRDGEEGSARSSDSVVSFISDWQKQTNQSPKERRCIITLMPNTNTQIVNSSIYTATAKATQDRFPCLMLTPDNVFVLDFVPNRQTARLCKQLKEKIRGIVDVFSPIYCARKNVFSPICCVQYVAMPVRGHAYKFKQDPSANHQKSHLDDAFILAEVKGSFLQEALGDIQHSRLHYDSKDYFEQYIDWKCLNDACPNIVCKLFADHGRPVTQAYIEDLCTMEEIDHKKITAIYQQPQQEPTDTFEATLLKNKKEQTIAGLTL